MLLSIIYIKMDNDHKYVKICLENVLFSGATKSRQTRELQKKRKHTVSHHI